MAEIKKILVPVDFSETSRHAIEYALDLAGKLGASLEMVHVYQLPMYTMPDGSLLAGPEVTARISEKAQATLDELAQQFQGRGVELGTHLREGMAHSEIQRAARDLECDMIVMGTHGRSGLGHLLLGSVAERVVRTSEVPVITVRHTEAKTS
jgi:nucleotide-binding universal stress UspA family protein